MAVVGMIMMVQYYNTIVLINLCFHNGPVMCPRSLIMAQGDFEGHYYRPRTHNRAIMKTPFS